MERKTLFITYFPLIFCWLLDYYTKSWAIANAHESFSFGFLHLAYYENHGIIMGSFETLPIVLRTVFLSTIGISLVASFPLIVSLIHFKSQKMLLGLSLLFGGILGNITDRIIHGFVVDMIYFKAYGFMSPVYNLADFVQWFAYFLIIKEFISEINHHIPDEDRRSLKWINPKFQYKFCLTLVSIVFLTTSIPIIFGLTFLKYSLEESALQSEIYLRNYLVSFGITSIFIQAFLCLTSVVIGKIISARVAGPLIGIKRYLQDTLEGKHYTFKLREKDDFKDIETPLTHLNEQIFQLQNQLKNHDCDSKSEEKKIA